DPTAVTVQQMQDPTTTTATMIDHLTWQMSYSQPPTTTYVSQSGTQLTISGEFMVYRSLPARLSQTTVPCPYATVPMSSLNVYNPLTAAARVGAQYASTSVDATSSTETGVELCTYDNVTPANNTTLDPLGQCASVLTQTLMVAPQVPRGDISVLHVERNDAGS